MRFDRSADFSPIVRTDTARQHYEETHRSIECPECDREFETQKAMDQVHGQPSHLFNCHLLTGT